MPAPVLLSLSYFFDLKYRMDSPKNDTTENKNDGSGVSL
jgi:hypothetical protein